MKSLKMLKVIHAFRMKTTLLSDAKCAWFISHRSNWLFIYVSSLNDSITYCVVCVCVYITPLLFISHEYTDMREKKGRRRKEKTTNVNAKKTEYKSAYKSFYFYNRKPFKPNVIVIISDRCTFSRINISKILDVLLNFYTSSIGWIVEWACFCVYTPFDRKME